MNRQAVRPQHLLFFAALALPLSGCGGLVLNATHVATDIARKDKPSERRFETALEYERSSKSWELPELIPENQIALPSQLSPNTVISIAYPRPKGDKGGDPKLSFRVVVSLVKRVDSRSVFVDGPADAEVELHYLPDFHRYQIRGTQNQVLDKRPSVDALIAIPTNYPLRVRKF